MSWLPKRTVVVPVDFSTASVDALKTALTLVARPKDLHIIYVTLPPPDFWSIDGWAVPSDLERVTTASKRLAKFLADCQAADVTQVVRDGDPGLSIADHAEECKADLIVMPSHGFHGVKRILLGSVTERVLRHAKCPILVLRNHSTGTM